MSHQESYHCEKSKWWLESRYNDKERIIEYIRRPIRDEDWMTPEQLKIRDENHTCEWTLSIFPNLKVCGRKTMTKVEDKWYCGSADNQNSHKRFLMP